MTGPGERARATARVVVKNASMSRPRIEVPSAAADRPSPALLAATAVIALAAGFGLLQWTLIDAPSASADRVRADPEPAPGMGRGEEQGSHGGEPETSGSERDSPETVTAGDTRAEGDPAGDLQPADPELTAAPSLDPAPDQDADDPAEVDPNTGDSVPAPEAGPPDDAPTPPHRLVPGRVAYLRCEGARPTDGPYPCPRDRDLERTVWDALGGLSECADRPVAGGAGDLRLTFSGGALRERGVRGGGESALSEVAILGCLEESLGAVTTTIRAPDLVVSFRFELERR